MHQGRGLERLAGLLLGQPLGGQPPQLVVDQGQELLGRLGSPCSTAERMRVTSFIDTAPDGRSGGFPDRDSGGVLGGVPSRPACIEGRLDSSLTGSPGKG